MQKLLLLVGLCVLVAHSEATDSRKLVCTFQSIPTFDVASDMEAQPCTHIIFKSVQPSAAMAIPSSGGPIQDHQDFKTAFPSATAKTLLEVDLTHTSSNIFRPQPRANFIQSIYNTVVAADFDGVDILWKQTIVDPTIKKNFTLLMQELKAELGELLLTATVSGVSPVIDYSYEVPLLDGVVDFFNVLTADLDRTSTPGTFPNAKDGMQKFVTEGATKAKLNMGIATYGYDTNPNASPRILPKYQLCAAVAPAFPITLHVDSDATVDEKAHYIVDEDFGGAFVTSLQLDDFDGVACAAGKYPVIQRIKDIL